MGIVMIVMFCAAFMLMLKSGLIARIHTVLSRMAVTGLFYAGLALLLFRFAGEMIYSSLDGITGTGLLPADATVNSAGADAIPDIFYITVTAAGVLLIVLSFVLGAINRFRTGKPH